MTRILLEVTALTPQRSLTMEARKRARQCSAQSSGSGPQWSLAMEARKRRVERQAESLDVDPAMEPGGFAVLVRHRLSVSSDTAGAGFVLVM